MAKTPRETVRYEVDTTYDPETRKNTLTLDKYVVVHRIVEGHRYTEYRRYRNGKLDQFWTVSGRGKIRQVGSYRCPRVAFEAWKRRAASRLRTAERELKAVKAEAKLEMPKDW